MCSWLQALFIKTNCASFWCIFALRFMLFYTQNAPILRTILVSVLAYRGLKKCSFVTQNYWYQFVDLLISSFVPNLFSFRPEPDHPNFCTWLAVRLSITHLPTCDWPAGDGVIQRQPPLLPDEEEIPNTDNFYNQIKSQFRKYSHNETPSGRLKSSLEDGVRRDGRVRTVKPWLIVIVPWSSSSGHVDSSVSAFVNIKRRQTAGCAGAEIPKVPLSIM